uniref:protein-tyrosine-phosphatase n=1 Tax=Nothobranchius rachovii TaxID=451742 RepID=A0A1A8PVX9_9TELE
MVWFRETERAPLSVILPGLYLGAESDVTQDRLSSLGISYVLSVSRCSPQPSFLPGSRYLRIPIDDSLRDELLPWIPQALHFIDAAMSSGASVLVHCAAGISRSPALAVAYIMFHLDLDLDRAYRFVKERRPSISPNFNFLGQLQHFQKTLNQRSAHSGDFFSQWEDNQLSLGPRSNSNSSTLHEVIGASSQQTDPTHQRLSDKSGTGLQNPWTLNPCEIIKPVQLQLSSGPASLLEKRKSLTLSLTPLGVPAPSLAAPSAPEAACLHSWGARGKPKAKAQSSNTSCRPAEDSQTKQGLLSPLSITLNKLLDWGERLVLGGMIVPSVRMGQPALSYSC